MTKNLTTVILAFLFTAAIIFLGYLSFGLWATIIFTSGFLSGFILWILVPTRPEFRTIRIPFWLTFSLFMVHRIEEKVSGFFNALSQITGVSTPSIISLPVILLVVTSVVAWLFVPFLIRRSYAFGYYLAWTFFRGDGHYRIGSFCFPFVYK